MKFKQKTIKYMLYFMIIVLLVSSFSFVNFSNSSSTDTVEFTLNVVINGENYPLTYSTPNQSNVYAFLYYSNYISFQSDYSVKCFDTICNDYITKSYWQVFVNNNPITMDYVLQEDDEIVLFYGEKIKFVDVNLDLNVYNQSQVDVVTIPQSVTINTFLLGYNATFVNDSVTCLFDICGNWSVLLNNNSISNYSSYFNDNDILSISLK